MIATFFGATMLALEAQSVINLRLFKLAAGGSDAQKESLLMVSEKIRAALEAGGTFVAGGSALTVIERYREHVSDNARRLSSGELST